MARKSAAHPGFKAVSRGIARRQGISQKRANAILAASTRRAGPKAPAYRQREGQGEAAVRLTPETPRRIGVI